ncbi:SAM-dependent methyltransferase [Pseudonocardia sp. MH-G8]|uniref:SAM-dependent methyltransferase n=1 Tax=Pseudonocardia sp. MH-G8 TaxID=1854588 RepID=UPI000BA17AD8|nr:SAM-dependent methyltransferase [Pseudonocardia sp. MH-G8]OZM77484.1 S-adenosyl methyltransferase [Pseudonocardia sp. MH-G8]
MTDRSTELRFDVPHSARVWNYWLGGKDNYPPDRAVGDAVAAQNPEILVIARQARQFLVRAVTFLAAEAGIDQFLDIGTGLPTMQNTHEVAQQHVPAARIVYVDNDPLVLAHARTLLVNTAPEGVTTYVHADVREPETILADARNVLNLDRPVAVMLLGILGHAAPDFADMRSIITTLMAGLPSGSYLVLQDGSDTSDTVRESAVMNNYQLRTLDQFRQCFEGLEMVEPGLVPTPLWRPAPTDIGTPEPIDSYCAVGRKP